MCLRQPQFSIIEGSLYTSLQLFPSIFFLIISTRCCLYSSNNYEINLTSIRRQHFMELWTCETSLVPAYSTMSFIEGYRNNDTTYTYYISVPFFFFVRYFDDWWPNRCSFQAEGFFVHSWNVINCDCWNWTKNRAPYIDWQIKACKRVFFCWSFFN